MLIVSDVHFGKNAMNDVDAFLEAAASRDHRIVVVAGDVTQSHTDEEYGEAVRFIRRLLDSGRVVVLTPGNHDLGCWRGERLRVDDRARDRFRNLLAPVLRQPEVVAHNDMDSVVRVGDDVFVALRSVHRGPKRYGGMFRRGRITGDQIAWTQGVLATLEGRSRLHLVTHRSLWEDPPDRHAALRRRARLERELLVPFGFTSYIHGHNHRFVARARETPKFGYAILHISAPTLSERTRGEARGWVDWPLEDRAARAEPRLVECVPQRGGPLAE